MKTATEYLETALDLMNRVYADPTIAEQSMRRAELLIKIAQVVSTERQAVALEKLASTVTPLNSGEFAVNTFDNSRDNF